MKWLPVPNSDYDINMYKPYLRHWQLWPCIAKNICVLKQIPHDLKIE
jgi:hypothetical protein